MTVIMLYKILYMLTLPFASFMLTNFENLFHLSMFYTTDQNHWA